MEAFKPRYSSKKNLEETPKELGHNGHKPLVTPYDHYDQGVSVNSGNKIISEPTVRKVQTPSPQPESKTLERLPWELERLVSAASNGILPSGSFKLESGTVPDLERYVLAWTGAYILGDTVQALSRLWEAQKVWTHSRNLN